MASGSNNLTSYQANILAVGRTFQVALGSTNASTAFNGSANISDIGVSGTLAITNGGTGTNVAPTQYGVIYADTASSYSSTGVGTAGAPLIGQGSAAPIFYNGLILTGTAANNYNAAFGGTVGITGNTTIGGTLVLTKNTDASGLAANAVALIVGGLQTEVHLEIDNNEIQAKSTDTTVGSLSLNYDGGDIALGVNNTTYSVGVRSTKDATSTSNGALIVSGGVAIAKKLYANGIYSPNGSIWAGTFVANTAQDYEYDIGAQSGAGRIFFYSAAAVDGNRGIYARNAANTGADIIKLNQNNRITTLAPLTSGITIYNNNIVRGTAPAETTTKAIAFRSEDSSGEQKILAYVLNGYDTTGVNSLQLRVYAPTSNTTDTAYGLYLYSAVSGDTTYSFATLKGCLTIEPNQSNFREGFRIKSYGNWATIALCGADNTAASGTSANTWSIGNAGGNIFITRNGSNNTNRVNFSSVDNYWRLHGDSTSSVADHYSSILHIYGNTYGNDAADIQSSYAGYMTFGDPGPQITFDTSATPGGGQAGALLFTDHDTAGTGASFHFLSNQTDWTVVSKRFHARTSISVRDAAASSASATSSATTYINQGSIELINSTPYIDFHYNNDASDYTHRLISVSDGLKLTSKSGTAAWLHLGNGSDIGGIYWPTFGGGWYMADSTYVRFYNNKQLLLSSSHATSSTNLTSQLIVSSVAAGSNVTSTAGADAAIELWRGSNASWQILNSSGTLYFKNNYTTAKQSTYTQTAMSIAYNTGNTTIAGTLTVNNFIKATLNGNTVTIGSANSSWCHFGNSANIPFYFNRTTAIDGDLGTTGYPVKNIYVGKANGAGIYYVGSASTQRMIRFIDNANDPYGNGISIGGGGLTVLGSGESADTILSNLGLTAAGGTETTYICSDGDINFYPNNNSYDASALVKITASKLWAGVNGNTTRESQVGAQAGAGQIYIYSQASTSGGRGLYIPAHGTGAAKTIISVDSNNNVTINGKYADVNGTKRDLQFRRGGTTVNHNQTVNITFSPAFSTDCLAVFAYCAQVGFGAYSTISAGNRSRTGCKIHQYNSASASMNIEWIAIGY